MESEHIGEELDFFKEKDESFGLIASICSPDWSSEEDFIRLTKILSQYQEQPELLAPHMAELLAPVNTCMNTAANLKKSHLTAVCKVAQLISRVRGHKYVAKYFPHEVFHIEMCLAVLDRQDRIDFENWETRYVLLLWLSILCLIPFDICSMDSTISITTTTAMNGAVQSKSLLINQIIEVCKIYLSDSGPTREAAALCLASLLTRPDIENAHLSEYVEWTAAKLRRWQEGVAAGETEFTSAASSLEIIGLLYSLAQIFKKGHRQKLIPFASSLYHVVQLVSEKLSQKTTRKLLTKLYQRIGLTFLPPRVAVWRYQRGQRSLQLTSSKIAESQSDEVAAEEDDDNGFEVQCEDGQLEGVIDQILTSLRDRDTVVRWSAAKGIGRITMRLSKLLADEIVGAVLELFEDYDADANWHGACLALAELARRGLLLPERLPEVVPFIEQALHYDVLRGQHSVGSHVRDAACYVCWAFARAYAPQVMKPFVESLAAAMLVTTLFDREVNCRRAAAAAFQENVGRQGNQNFPFGLEIIQIADYFSVGNRINAYVSIAVDIAKLNPPYLVAFLNDVRAYKVTHWDEEIRILAAKSLAKLATVSIPDALYILPDLIAGAASSQLAVRHGSIVAIAELLFSLTAQGHEFAEAMLADIMGIVQNLEKNRLYRGRGSEIVRQASCLLIENTARSWIALSPKMQLSFLEALNEHMRQPHEQVQQAAATALREFLFTYFSHYKSVGEKIQKLTISRYLEGLRKEDNVAATRGYALAIAALPENFVTQSPEVLSDVLSCLDEATRTSKLIAGEYDANTCCNAMFALVELIRRIAESPIFGSSQIQQCFDILVRGCEDYSVDKRGDVGSWTRMMAMHGLSVLVSSIVSRRNAAAEGAPFFHEAMELLITYPERPKARVKTSTATVKIETMTLATDARLVFRVPSQRQLVYNHSQHALETHVAAGAFDVVIVKRPPPKAEKGEADIAASLPVAAAAVEVRSIDMCRIINVVLKQLSEKLDSVREVAGNVLVQLLRLALEDKEVSIPQYGLLIDALSCCQEGDTDSTKSMNRGQIAELLNAPTINWAKTNHVFPFVARLLTSELYFQAVFQGLVISIGGLTETITKESSQCLLNWCQECCARGAVAKLVSLFQAVLGLFRDHLRCDRVILPLMKTATILFRNAVFEVLSTEEREMQAEQLLKLLCLEMRNSTNVGKICQYVDLLILLTTFSRRLVRYMAMKELFRYLGHKYPRVRKCTCSMLLQPCFTLADTAEALYLQFLSDASLVGESVEDVLCAGGKLEATSFGFFISAEEADMASNLLLSVPWDSESNEAIKEGKQSLIQLTFRDLRVCKDLVLKKELEICPHFHIKANESSSSKSSKRPAKADELDSYESLVREAGAYHVSFNVSLLSGY